MSARDMFETFIESLTEDDRRSLKEVILRQQEDLLAARSEDARVRLVDACVQEIHDLLRQPQRA